MKENHIWSTGAGQWCGIPVRIHLFLYLFIVIIFGAEWNVGFPNNNLFVGTATATALAFLLSIAIHEAAHAFAAISVGGRVQEIVLLPWGGNGDAVLPDRGYSPLIVHLAGPFISGMVFLLGVTLLVQTEHTTILHLVNPFQPHKFSSVNWQVSIVEIMTWVNFQLMIVNLIPCFPFDGARIVRALILASRVELPRFRIETAIKLIGHAFAFGLIGIAIFYRRYEPGDIQPAWLFLLLLGITLIFTARYSMSRETEELDEDWSDLDELEYNSVYESSLYLEYTEESDNIAYSQWLTEKQESRHLELQLLEQQEDMRADGILEKLHAHGGELGCLTDDERLILHRFSERIRRRREQSV